MSDPEPSDPDYDRHGGFPVFEPARPGPGFGKVLAGMRTPQDLAVSVNPDPDTWEVAADRVDELPGAGRRNCPTRRMPKPLRQRRGGGP